MQILVAVISNIYQYLPFRTTNHENLVLYRISNIPCCIRCPISACVLGRWIFILDLMHLKCKGEYLYVRYMIVMDEDEKKLNSLNSLEVKLWSLNYARTTQC